MTDLVILWIIGIAGRCMRAFDIPVAPCIVALTLGPLAEQHFRRAMQISQGDPSVFFTHPLSATLLAIAAILLIAPVLMRLRKRTGNGVAS